MAVVKFSFAPRFKKWWSRAERNQREMAYKTIQKLGEGVKNSIDGRPILGKAKALRGVQVPVYEIRIEKDLRLLYHIIFADSIRGLYIYDVADHDHLNRRALHSVDHLVHAKKTDLISSASESDMMDELYLMPYRNTEGVIIGEEKFNSLSKKEKDEWMKLGKKESEKIFDDFLNEIQNRFVEEKDAWSEEKLHQVIQDACIWEAFDVDEMMTTEEREKIFFEKGDFRTKISLKEEQRKLLKKDQAIFILEGVAGTGKTTLIEERFLIFIKSNDWKEEVLFLTHNKQLAKSVKARLKKRVKEEDWNFIDLAVIDVETWYRNIEKEYLREDLLKAYIEDIGIMRGKLKTIQESQKILNRDIIKIERNIENYDSKIAKLERKIEGCKEIVPVLKRSMNSAKSEWKHFKSKMESRSKYISSALEKKDREKLAKLRKKKDKERMILSSNEQNIENAIREIEDLKFENKKNNEKIPRLKKEFKNNELENTPILEKLKNHIGKKEEIVKKHSSKIHILSDLEYRRLTKFKPDRKITYDVFVKINQGKTKDASNQSLLWEEYRGVLLGHGKNQEAEQDYNELSLSDYEKISRDRGMQEKEYKDKTKQRREVYREIQSFKKKLEKFGGKYKRSNGGWTDQEQAKYTQQLLRKKSKKYQAIFIDEVQDLTELQIAIMLDLLKGWKKFEVAGDTSQSVYPSAFRWDDLRSQIYKKLDSSKAQDHYRMDTNYRSTPYLVKAANFILDQHEDVMSETRTTIRQRAKGLEKGTHPSIIRLTEEKLIKNLIKLGLPSVFCPLLVRNEDDVERLSEKLATSEQKKEGVKNPNVMTIPGCKGLEYENVIIWDPCSGSGRILDNFYHYKKGSIINDPESIALELRHIFVGITRARYRLALIGPDDEGKNKKENLSGLGFFENKSEYFSKDNGDVLESFTKDTASTEEFVDQAKIFEDAGAYRLAAEAYRSAGIDNERFRCEGEYFLNNEEFDEASSKFKDAGDKTDNKKFKLDLYIKANDCLSNVLDENSSIEILGRKAKLCQYVGDEKGAKKIKAYRYEKIGLAEKDMEKRNQNLRKSAKLFREVDELEKSIELYREIEDFRNVCIIALEINSNEYFFNSIESVLKNEEKYFLILYSIYSGDSRWKTKVCEYLGVGIDELPESQIDQVKQMKYANEEQKATLQLEKSEKSGNLNDQVQALKKLGEWRKASAKLNENQEYELGLDLLLKNYNDKYEHDVKDLLKILLVENGIKWMFNYYEKIPLKGNEKEAVEKLFPSIGLQKIKSFVNEKDWGTSKNSILKSKLEEKIFLRELFTDNTHPFEMNYNGMVGINTTLLMLLIRNLVKNKGNTEENMFYLMAYYNYYIYQKSIKNYSSNSEYNYIAAFSFFCSVITVTDKDEGAQEIHDEVLFNILSLTYVTIIHFEKELRQYSVRDEKKNMIDRFSMITFFYSCFGEFIGRKEILKFKKTFDFIWTIYMEIISKLFEDMGLETNSLEEYSYHAKKFWKEEVINHKIDLSSEKGRAEYVAVENSLIHLENNLNIGGVSISGEFHKSGVKREKSENESLLATSWYLEGYDDQDFANEENVNNFLKYLALIERKKIETKSSSWLRKVISEIHDKNMSNENVMDTDGEEDELNDKEKVTKQILDIGKNNNKHVKQTNKKKNGIKETNVQNDRVAALIGQALTSDEKSETKSGNQLEENIKPENPIIKEKNNTEIIEIEIQKEENSSLIVIESFPELPYEIAYKSILNKQDPLKIIRKIGDDFIDKSDEGKGQFREMRWDWIDEINKKWLEVEGDSCGKIALIAARQYLIDKNKQLDRFEKDKLSNSELTDHRSDVQLMFKEMKVLNLFWINRALMSI